MQTIILTLQGRVVPKARPRLSKDKVHLSSNYRSWRDIAETELAIQFNGRPTINKAIVEIQFLGNHRGDLDNLAGAILDALVAAKILKDDRLSYVCKLIVEHIESKNCEVEIGIHDIT